MAIREHKCTYDADGASCPICGQTASESLIYGSSNPDAHIKLDEDTIMQILSVPMLTITPAEFAAAKKLSYDEGYNARANSPLEVSASNKRAYDEGYKSGVDHGKRTYKAKLSEVYRLSAELNRALGELTT